MSDTYLRRAVPRYTRVGARQLIVTRQRAIQQERKSKIRTRTLPAYVLLFLNLNVLN